MQTVINQAGGWIHFCMKLLRTLNSNSRSKIKIKKPTSFNVLFKIQWYYSLADTIWPDVTLSAIFARRPWQSGPLAAASPVPDATGLPAAVSLSQLLHLRIQ
jgi:hypothetical protein